VADDGLPIDMLEVQVSSQWLVEILRTREDRRPGSPPYSEDQVACPCGTVLAVFVFFPGMDDGGDPVLGGVFPATW